MLVGNGLIEGCNYDTSSMISMFWIALDKFPPFIQSPFDPLIFSDTKKKDFVFVK